MATRAALWRTLTAVQVYGANTDVGKTIISTVLCNAALQADAKPAFLKPLSTGPLSDADDRHVKRFAAGTYTKCLHQFNEPVSPHLAAKEKSRLEVPRDKAILWSIYNTLSAWCQNKVDLALVETAGGVHSPGPRGNSQVDLYRPLRLPVVLVADSKLGGISASISAYESLLLRGYDVDAVLLFRDEYYQNHDYLHKFFRGKNIPLVSLAPPPPRQDSQDQDSLAKDKEAMQAYYRQVSQEKPVQRLLSRLAEKNEERNYRLHTMAGDANDIIWYPFTQHQGMKPSDINVIDSAYDDFFQTYTRKDNTGGLVPAFDGSASWWTQGLGHGNPDLALSAAYAAGRYGHVMFAGGVHEPALALAETLLKEMGNLRLQKVFYTDNGSTGMEVAVKMALRAACVRNKWDAREDEIYIIGLKGAYHGDTMGVMDCSEPSTFNEKVEWYRPRGFWFTPPRIQMVDGKWTIMLPEEFGIPAKDCPSFDTLDEVFDVEKRRGSHLAQEYGNIIRGKLINLMVNEKIRFGALILEPVVLGAGGMFLCDPLFQRMLVDEVRTPFSRNNPTTPSTPQYPDDANPFSFVPVIFDEVFTGLYRLGRRTSGSFLRVHPDIVVNAKLLTGGLVPLCTTLASQEVFDAFSSSEKSDALLHGHSYTAHPIGCNVAVESLKTMFNMEKRGAWDQYKGSWSIYPGDGVTQREQLVWSVWSKNFVEDLSRLDSVEGVWALGTVLSISFKDPEGGGYTSSVTKELQRKLADGGDKFSVHSRCLGNVLYLMTSITTKRNVVEGMESLLWKSLKQ